MRLRHAYCVISSAMATLLTVNYCVALPAPFDARETKVTPAASEPRDEFGFSLALSGPTLIAGAPRKNELGVDSGAAYVFNRQTNGDWNEVAQLAPPDSSEGDGFGWSAAISGGFAIVGSNGDDDNGSNSGSAYIFQRDLGGPQNWGQLTKLSPSDPGLFDQFGYSVAISGDTAVIGAWAKDGNGGDRSGAAYIFQKDHGGPDAWGEVAKLTAPNGTGFDLFGYSVAVSANTILIGAPADDNFGDKVGSVYSYQRDASHPDGWRPTEKLTPSDSAPQNKFGGSVALSDGIALIGAYWDDDGGAKSGAAYVYEQDSLDAANWNEVAKISADDAAVDDWFGISVAISENVALIGAWQDDDKGGNSGSAYLFERNVGGADNWGQLAKLTGSDTAGFNYFGQAVALSGSLAAVGAYGDGLSGNGPGKVYAYAIPEPVSMNLAIVTALGLSGRLRRRP